MTGSIVSGSTVIERMHPLDALFLHVEDGISHMHIGSCSVFAGPAPSFEAVSTLIESKLPQLIRYRQRVRLVPGGLGHPVWVDDQHFDLAHHLRHTALPNHGDERDLENLVGRLMSQPLDRDHPLWEAWMVDGLPDGRWAIVSKVHHCMVDGISGTDLISVLLDADRSSSLLPVRPWRPRPAPSDLQLTVDALTQAALMPVRQAMSWRPTVSNLTGTVRQFGDIVAGIRSFGARASTRRAPTSIGGSIGRQRRWAVGRCTLDDIKPIRTELGGSVNDVVLAAISGAFRTLLIERGECVDGVTLNTLVPVSTRPPGDHTPDNQVSLIIAELPVGIADPVERLAAVRAQMSQLKASHQVEAGAAIVASAELVPPAVIAAGARAVMARLRANPQQTLQTVTTNVAGPRHALFALGREMIEYLPFVPVSEGVRIGIAIMSYNGRLTFGVTGDFDTAADVHEMAEQIGEEVRILRERACTIDTEDRHARII